MPCFSPFNWSPLGSSGKHLTNCKDLVAGRVVGEGCGREGGRIGVMVGVGGCTSSFTGDSGN